MTDPEPLEDDELDDAISLIAQLIQANYNQYAASSQSLIDTYEEQARRLQATLNAVRDGVEHLFSGDFMPTPHAVMKALYPPKHIVDVFMDEGEL